MTGFLAPSPPQHSVLLSWAARATVLWSVTVGVLGLAWALGWTGFPFGAGDARAQEVGSLLGSAEPVPTGAAVAALGFAGAVVAVLLGRTPRARPLVVFAWAWSAVLLVLVPDIRVIQNFAYLFFGYVGMWDTTLPFLLIGMVGGVLWAATALGHRRLRPGATARSATPFLAGRWGIRLTYVAAALALPYPAVRLAWALMIPLGVPDGYLDGSSLTLRLGETGLAALGIGGAVLTLGLVMRWGEVFPRWIPFLRGRPVPVWLAVVPGLWAATIIVQAGLRIWIWAVVDPGAFTADSWGTGGPGLFFLPWGLTVAAATYAYYLRRTRSQAVREGASRQEP